MQNLFELINVSSKSNFLLLHINNVVGKPEHSNLISCQALIVYFLQIELIQLRHNLMNVLLPEG